MANRAILIRGTFIAAIFAFCLPAPLQAGPIHQAVQSNNLNSVKQILESDPQQLNAVDNQNSQNTPLHLAAQSNRTEIAKYLLAKGADPNVKTGYQYTPLHYAAMNGRIEIIELLLKSGKKVDVDATDNRGFSALMYGVQYGRKDVLEKMVKAGADVNLKTRYNQYPLHMACQYNRPDLALVLIENKAKIEVKDGSGATPLYYAAQRGATKVVETLLAKGADAKLKTNYNHTVLHAACQAAVPAVVEMILKAGVEVNALDNSRTTALQQACYRGNVDVVKLLIKYKANVNLPEVKQEKPQDPKQPQPVEKPVIRQIRPGVPQPGRSQNPAPLFIACSRNNPELVKVLLEAGADATYVDAQQNTALHMAASVGNQNRFGRPVIVYVKGSEPAADASDVIITALLKHKADPNLVNAQKLTPLQIAVAGNNYGAVNALLPVSKEINVSPSSGETLFHWSARNGLDKAIATLIKLNKGEQNKKDDAGQTPLFMACAGGHEKVVELLLTDAVKVDEPFADGETMLHVAAWGGHADVVELLLAAKADPYARDESGQTPLHAAAWNGHVTVIANLLESAEKKGVFKDGEYQPIHAAAWKGHTAVVQLLVAAGADVNAKDRDGLTPLHKAAWNGHVTTARLLIANGANRNAKDNDDYTPAVKADEQGHKALAIWLKDPNAKLPLEKTKPEEIKPGGLQPVIPIPRPGTSKPAVPRTPAPVPR